MSLPILDGDNKEKGKKGLPEMNMPPVDGSGFEEVDVEDALYTNNDDQVINEDLYGDIDNDVIENELPGMRREEDIEEGEDDYYPEYEDDLEEDEDKFIDKKKKRILPFGGKKSKKMFVKSSDFDNRKNKLANTKIMQLGIIGVILLLFFVGLKNTFLPSHVYTSEQIKQFAREGAGQTGFPEERGRAYVENFMDSFLTFDRTKPELLNTLSHYYGEETFSSGKMSSLNMRWRADAKQEVVIPPKVFEHELLSDYSAQYKVSAYVTNTDGEYTDGKTNIGRWLSFAINVYYDEKTDSLAIIESSPTLIPGSKISKQNTVPKKALLGNGEVNKEVLAAATPTIDGFVEAYAKSSYNSHNSILQYIEDKDDISLYDGFGGAVELNGSPANSIKKVVYNTSREGVHEVDVTVNWLDNLVSGEEAAVEYTSRYEMEIKSDGNGRYTVTSFVPYTYYK